MSNCPTTGVPTQFCTCVQCQKPVEPVAASHNGTSVQSGGSNATTTTDDPARAGDRESSHAMGAERALSRATGAVPDDKSGRGVTLSVRQLREALEFIDPDNQVTNQCDLRIEWSDTGHSGPGYYAWDVDYPDEGSILLGEPRSE